jgi:hypothetical protein
VNMASRGENGQGRCAQCGRMFPAGKSRAGIMLDTLYVSWFCTLDCARWFLHREIVRVGEKSSMGLDEHQNRCTIG